jgi:hypothetical protein
VNPLSSGEVNALLKKSRNLDFFSGVDEQPRSQRLAEKIQKPGFFQRRRRAQEDLISITFAACHRFEADGLGAAAIQPPATPGDRIVFSIRRDWAIVS